MNTGAGGGCRRLTILVASCKGLNWRRQYRRNVLKIIPKGIKSEAESAYLKSIDIDYPRAYLLPAYPGKPCVSEKVSADQELVTTH